MTENKRVILVRRLTVRGEQKGGNEIAYLEIGVEESPDPMGDGEGKAAFRVRPLTDWVTVFGVDLMQAVALAIQLGEQEAQSLDAELPD